MSRNRYFACQFGLCFHTILREITPYQQNRRRESCKRFHQHGQAKNAPISGKSPNPQLQVENLFG
jgi:hypothetical protein